MYIILWLFRWLLWPFTWLVGLDEWGRHWPKAEHTVESDPEEPGNIMPAECWALYRVNGHQKPRNTVTGVSFYLLTNR